MNDKLTTKDVITILRNLQNWLYYSSMNGGTSIQRKAIDIAIGALEQPEPCEDAVSREAVQDTIHKWCGDCVDCETIAYEVITKIPPVTPKQRTGKWIKNIDITADLGVIQDLTQWVSNIQLP